MSGHTKGPWYVESILPCGGEIRSVDGDVWVGSSNSTDDPKCSFPSPAEGTANARLMAAAPELLEALKGVLPYMEQAESAGLVGDEGCHWPVELVRAAIAKAEGK